MLFVGAECHLPCVVQCVARLHCTAFDMWHDASTVVRACSAEPEYVRAAIANASTPERRQDLLDIQEHLLRAEEAVGLMPAGTTPPVHGQCMVSLRRVQHLTVC